MNDTTVKMMRDYTTNPPTTEENIVRIQHVIERLKERAGIEANEADVSSIEARIEKARHIYAKGLKPNAFQAHLLWDRFVQNKQHWKIIVKGKPVVVIVCKFRGVVSVETQEYAKNRMEKQKAIK